MSTLYFMCSLSAMLNSTCLKSPAIEMSSVTTGLYLMPCALFTRVCFKVGPKSSSCASALSMLLLVAPVSTRAMISFFPFLPNITTLVVSPMIILFVIVVSNMEYLKLKNPWIFTVS